MKKNVLACLLWAFLLSGGLFALPTKGAMFEVLQLDPYPVITNRYVRDYNGDSVVHATANGLPAIIALPGQDINRLLGALGLTREKFAEFNDLSPMVLTRLKPGAVYYLKAKMTKAPLDFHIVQFKEDLWDVSQRYGVRKSVLLSRNRLTGDALAPGTKLFLNSKRSKKQALEVIKLPDPGPNAPGPWDALLREIRPQPVATTANPGTTPGNVGRQPIRPPLRYANDPRVRVHTVKDNESLFTISQLYNTTILDLKNWNDLQTSVLMPNDQLVVNGGELAQSGVGQPVPTNTGFTQPGITVNNPAVPNPNTPATTLPFNQTATATADKMHTVERGETVYSIARKYNVSARDLMLWNGFDNNTVLNTGQTVLVKNQPVSTTPAGVPGAVPTSPVMVQEVPVNPQNAFQQAAVDTAKQIRTGIYALDPPGITTFNMTAPASSQVATGTRPLNTQQPVGNNPSTVTATNPAQPVLTNGYYVVQRNEDIFMISQKFNVPVTSLRQWNNLSPTTPLIEGQSLLVRDPFAANPTNPTTIGSSPAPRDVNTGVSNQVVTYRPKPGEKPKKHVVEAKETLFALSKKYGKSVEELKAYNGLPNDQISIGQELIVGYTAAPASTKKSTKKSNKETGSVVLAGGLPVNNTLPPDQLGTSFGISQAASGEESAYYQIAAPATKIIGSTPPATTELDKPATKAAPANATYHEVAKGESLYSISRKYNVSIKEILNLNNMKDNDVIVVGQKLRVK